MDIRKLQRAIVDGLEDVKAQDILVLNTEHLSSLFERVIIASGTSNRQTKALASGVRDAVREAGFPVLATEGGENGEWIIVDCGAAVAHIMQPAIREYYRLEEIWGGKTVKMKLGRVAKGLVKASEGADDEDEDEDDEPVAKKPARKTAAKKATKPAVPVQPARVAVAAKPEPSQRPASKAAAAKKVAATVAAAKKVVARKKAIAKAPVTKTIVVKAVDRRTAAAKTVSAEARKTTGPARKTAAGGRAAAPSGRKATAKTISKPSSKPSTRR